VVLEHMEAQLKMALKLQDDADKLWLEVSFFAAEN